MTPSVKVGVSVFLDEMGQVGFTSTSKNQITVLGLLECAKAIVLNQLNSKPQEESRILTPNAG